MEVGEEKLGGGAFVVGGLSFIPLIGVPFGVAAIVWGLATKKLGGKKLALVGTSGIVFTVVLYGGLYYFGMIQRGGVYDELRGRMAQTTLNALPPAIEFYRLQYGSYPDSLEQLRQSQPKGTPLFINDPTDTHIGSPGRLFFYKRVGADHYYLRGVGPDGTPFTADDILPEVDPNTVGKTGLLIAPPAADSPR